jgi:CCR4-NOT transcription complex subunit 2
VSVALSTPGTASNSRYLGQPQQRPPNLAPSAGLAGPFRGPYPTYGMPPRSVIQGGYVPGLQPTNHRAAAAQQAQAQSLVPQPSPAYLQQRAQSTFPFAGGLGQPQHQQSTLQQHTSNPASQLSQLQQQQQPNGPSSTQPSHLPPSSATPSISGTAPSVSSASEVGFDPNDFPALGSTPSNVTTSSTPNGSAGNGTATSYASQAGTGVLLATSSGASGASGLGLSGVSSAVGATGSTNQPRDFTPDDFPALGGQVHPQSQPQPPTVTSHPPQPSQNQDNHAHPPGLNGFQHGSDHSLQHRPPNLLGSLGNGGVPQSTPGMLNLGPTQARAVHPGFQQSQSEAEKQQHQQRVSVVVDLLAPSLRPPSPVRTATRRVRPPCVHSQSAFILNNTNRGWHLSDTDCRTTTQ